MLALIKILFNNDIYRFCGYEYVGARIARPEKTIQLSEYGLIVENSIKNISQHYPDVIVDKYIIMPNHIHMIFSLNYNKQFGLLDENGRALRAPTSLSNIINQLKGNVSKQIGFSIWQKSFYDRIIRNEQEYIKIWDYIENNPITWENDCYYK